MKKILFLLAILIISSGVLAQEKLEFSQVIKADSVKRENLYIALKEWVVTSYNSPKDVIQMDDKDAGLLICNGVINYSPKKITHLSYKGIIKYSLKIQVKDNRYKVDISNFVHQVDPDCPPACQLGLITNSDIFTDKGSRKKYQNEVWDDIKIKVQEFSYSMFQRLYQCTKNIKVQDTVDDDW